MNRLGTLAIAGLGLLSLAGGILAPVPGSARTKEETVVFAIQSDIQTYHPHDHILRMGIIVIYHIFDNLVVRDLSTGKLIPNPATSWRTLDDVTWEFKLRKDVRFHNGEKFTAHTVKFSYDRALAPANKLPQYANHKVIASVEVVDQRFQSSVPDRPGERGAGSAADQRRDRC